MALENGFRNRSDCITYSQTPARIVACDDCPLKDRGNKQASSKNNSEQVGHDVDGPKRPHCTHVVTTVVARRPWTLPTVNQVCSA
eukprot:1855252-Amphidinium_carterae.1